MAPQAQTITIVNRMILMQKLTNHRVELNAVLKVLSTNQEITPQSIEALLLSLDEALTALLNPR